MSDYMRAGNDLDEQNPFDETPFTRIPEVRITTDERIELILDEAEKIRRTCEQRGSIASDENVIQALGLPNEHTSAEAFYAYKVGAVAQTCDTISWNTAYRIDIDDAPAPGSDEFQEAASTLDIPDSRRFDLVPKFVRGAYRLLYEHVEDTGRPIHPHRLEADANVILTSGIYPQAYRYLNQLPGVIPPDENAPAWAYIEEETASTPEQGHV